MEPTAQSYIQVYLDVHIFKGAYSQVSVLRIAALVYIPVHVYLEVSPTIFNGFYFQASP